ncbi:MAG: hypothetical protein M3N19_06485, partial [Candidatus Eremiobacteraeota bacterium]|nr:hypothetical protein [Candidatus Eremiobacteraeota bacterium]
MRRNATIGVVTSLAICASVSLVLFGTPARAKNAAAMQHTTLPFGSTLIVRRDPAVATVALELWFRAPSVGFNQPAPGLARYAATAIAASKANDGVSLSDLIKSVGGRFAISAYPDAISVAASVPAGTEARVLRAMTAAYFTPVVTVEGMHGGLRDVVVAATQQRFDPEGTLHDGIFGLLFSSGPAHYAGVPSSAQALGQITMDGLKAFAGRAFRSSNAIIAVAGNVQTDLSGAIVAGKVDGERMLAPIDSVRAPQPASTTRPFAEDGVGLGWVGPSIADPKAATALDFIADYLFRPETGVVARASAVDAPDAFLSGQFVTLHDPGVMLVEIAGKHYDAVRLRAQTEIARLHT